MGKIIQRLAKHFVVTNMKFNKVVFPELTAMTINICKERSTAHQGIRHFNRDLSPGFRYFNDHTKFTTRNNHVDSTIKQSTIDLEFKNGEKFTYEANNKDSLQIFKDLIIAGRGKYFAPKRTLPPIKVGRPRLEQIE